MDPVEEFSEAYFQRQEEYAQSAAKSYKRKLADDGTDAPPKKVCKASYEWVLAYSNGRRISKGTGAEELHVTQKQLDALCPVDVSGGI